MHGKNKQLGIKLHLKVFHIVALLSRDTDFIFSPVVHMSTSRMRYNMSTLLRCVRSPLPGAFISHTSP